MTRDYPYEIAIGEETIEAIAEYDFFAGCSSCATDPGSSDLVEISQVYEKHSRKIIELDDDEIIELQDEILKSIHREGF